MFKLKRNINENLKKKIINFLLESEDERENDVYYGLAGGDAAGANQIQFAMRVMNDPNISSALRDLSLPEEKRREKFEKEKATKETQKAGLSEIKKGRSYLYLVWLHGNKYYKSIWFKALMAAENYRQKYVENPKVSDTEAIPDPYLVPNIDEESISEFNKFFKGFKKRLQESLFKNMDKSLYDSLLNDLNPYLKKPVEKYEQKGEWKDISKEKVTESEENLNEIDFEYYTINKFLQSYLKINPKTGEVKKDSNIDMSVVEDISKKIENVNAYTETKNYSLVDSQKYQRIIDNFQEEERQREKEEYSLSDQVSSKLSNILSLSVKEELIKKINKLKEKLNKDLEKIKDNKKLDDIKKNESIKVRSEEYQKEVETLVDESIKKNKEFELEFSEIEKFLSTATIEKLNFLPLKAKDLFIDTIKKEIKKIEKNSEKIVADSKKSYEEKEEEIYSLIKDFNNDVDERLGFFIGEFEKEQEDTTLGLIRSEKEKSEKQHLDILSKRGLENQVQREKFYQTSKFSDGVDDKISFVIDEKGNQEFSFQNKKFSNMQELVEFTKSLTGEINISNTLRDLEKTLRSEKDSFQREIRNDKDLYNILVSEYRIETNNIQKEKTKNEISQLMEKIKSFTSIVEKLEADRDILNDVVVELESQDSGLEQDSEVLELKKKEIYERIFKRIESEYLHIPNFFSPDEFMREVDPSEKDFSKVDEDDVLKQSMLIDSENIKTNLDMFEEAFKLYFFLKMSILSMERQQNEKIQFDRIPSDMDRYKKIEKRADIKQEEYKLYLKKLNSFIKECRDHIEDYIVSLGSKYPELTSRINLLLATISKYGNYANDKFHKDKFWTFRLIAGASGFWKPASFASVGENMSNTLLQAMFIESLIRTNQLAEIRTFTLEKWLNIFEIKFKLKDKFDIKGYSSLGTKLSDLQGKLKKKKTKPTAKKSELESEIMTALKADANFVQISKEISELLRDKQEYSEKLEFAEMTDAYDDIDSYTNELEAIEQELAERKLKIVKLEKKIKQKVLLSAEGKPEIEDKDILGQIKGIESEIEKGPKFVDSQGNVKLGNLVNQDFSPNRIFNQLRLAKITSDDKIELSQHVKDAIQAYSNYSIGDETESGTQSQKYQQRMGEKMLGDLSPDFIERLLNDNDSPYKQFHSQLMYDYFSRKRGSENQRLVRQAIIDWMRANYNSSWLPNGLRSSRSSEGLKAGSNPADDIIWNMVVDYAFGITRRKLNISGDTMKLIQLPQEAVNDLMYKFESMGWENVMTPADPSKQTEIFVNKNERKRFFTKLIKAATFTMEKGQLKPIGTISEAVFNGLLTPDFPRLFNSFVESLGDKKLNEYFENSIEDAEFYETYKDSVIDPELYRK